jgi:hypothetical protein
VGTHTHTQMDRLMSPLQGSMPGAYLQPQQTTLGAIGRNQGSTAGGAGVEQYLQHAHPQPSLQRGASGGSVYGHGNVAVGGVGTVALQGGGVGMYQSALGASSMMSSQPTSVHTSEPQFDASDFPVLSAATVRCAYAP